MNELAVMSIKPLGGEAVTIIGMDGEEHEFRRFSADEWEILIGSSWELLYLSEPVEEAYQKCRKDAINGA